MHVHAVLLNMKADARQDDFDAAVQKLREMKGKVPGVLEVHGGPNVPDYPSDYSHVIVVLFDKRETLTHYREHPLHDEAVPFLERVIANSAPMDIGDQ